MSVIPSEGCFHGGSADKASACSVGDLGSIPGLGRSPGGGNGNPLQYSCLKNFHGLRSLVGYSPWGHKELDTTEWLHFLFLKLEEIWKQKHSHVKTLLQLFLHGIREQSAVNSPICSCLKFLTNNQDSLWTAQSQNPINENACCSLWLFFKKIIFYHKKLLKEHMKRFCGKRRISKARRLKMLNMCQKLNIFSMKSI